MPIIKELLKSVSFITFSASEVCYKSPQFFQHRILWILIEHSLTKIEARVDPTAIKELLISFDARINRVLKFAIDSIRTLVCRIIVNIFRSRIYGQEAFPVRGFESIAPCCDWAMDFKPAFKFLESFFVSS